MDEIISKSKQIVIFERFILPRYCEIHKNDVGELLSIEFSCDDTPKELDRESLELLHRLTGEDIEYWENIQNQGKSAFEILVKNILYHNLFKKYTFGGQNDI